MRGTSTTKQGWLLSIGGLTLMVGCTTAAPMPVLSPAMEAVDLRLSEPPPGSRLLGSVEASHGYGCGNFGEIGTEEGALASLKAVAFTRGANYVHVKERNPPHLTELCFDQHYRISGLAYRIGSDVATVQSAAQPRPPGSP